MSKGRSVMLTSLGVLAYLLSPLTALSQERAYEIFRPNYPERAVKLVEVRNLQSEQFAQDLEIEVKNVSNKPIYYIGVVLILRSSAFDRGGIPPGLGLNYGRGTLVDNREQARPEDKSLMPGESLILKVNPAEANNFQADLADGRIAASATNLVKIVFTTINFGDGTGFQAGQPYPNQH